MKRCVVFFVFAVFSFGVVVEVEADEHVGAPSRVVISPSDCASMPVSFDALVPALTLEFATVGVDDIVIAPRSTDAETTDAGLAYLRIEPRQCGDAIPEVVVTVDDLVTRKTVTRFVSLVDVEEALRARVLALAVVDLLFAAWIELASSDAPLSAARVPFALREAVRLRVRSPVDVADVANSAPQVQGSSPASSPFRLEASADGRAFVSGGLGLFGMSGRFAASPFVELPVRIVIEARASVGSSRSDLGTVHVGFYGGAFGLAYVWNSGPFSFDVGVLAELGAAHVRGAAARVGIEGRSSFTFTSFVSFEALVRASLSTYLELHAGVALGYALRGVDVAYASNSLNELSGPTLGLRFGAGYGW